MNAITVWPCILALSLLNIGIPTYTEAAPSGSDSAGPTPGETHEKRKPTSPRTANPRLTPPSGTPRQVPKPPDRAQEVEERVRSGQMEPPIAQNEISEQLEQLHSGSNESRGEAAIGQSSR
jgi:hypothetical protein